MKNGTIIAKVYDYSMLYFKDTINNVSFEYVMEFDDTIPSDVLVAVNLAGFILVGHAPKIKGKDLYFFCKTY